MIACISVPYFAAAVERRAATALAEKPLAIGGQPWEAKPIFAFSREVARHGVRAGMTLRLAHVLSPEAAFIPAAPPRYAQASGEIVDVLLDFSPLVEPQELWHPFAGPAVRFTVDGRTLPARYFLDFEGLPRDESLFLAGELGRTLRGETHLAPAIGLAAGKFAAQVAATLGRPNHARVIEPGEDAPFLASQTIAFLPLEGETLRRLQLLGIRTLGDLARIPRAAFVAQFGAEAEGLHRLASGQPAERPIRPPRDGRRHEQASHTFEPAVADSQVLASVVRRLAGQVVARLETGGLEAREVYLVWEWEDGRHDQSTLTLRRPTAEGRHLTEAWLDLLGGVIGGQWTVGSDQQRSRGAGEQGRKGERPAADDRAPAGIIRLTLGSRDLLPAAARQLSLFDDGRARAERELQETLRDLLARHNAGCFFRPVLAEIDHPLPERRFQLQPLGVERPVERGR
jgi:DNA polymerase-4